MLGMIDVIEFPDLLYLFWSVYSVNEENVWSVRSPFVTDNQLSDGATNNQLLDGPPDDQPSEGPTDDQPSDGPSDDQLADGPPDDQLSDEPTDNVIGSPFRSVYNDLNIQSSQIKSKLWRHFYLTKGRNHGLHDYCG